jgi:hypothetical protein
VPTKKASASSWFVTLIPMVRTSVMVVAGMMNLLGVLGVQFSPYISEPGVVRV